ncbi:MAG TPA: hypothetical protein VGD03_01120 [Frankiaceae bacterium]
MTASDSRPPTPRPSDRAGGPAVRPASRLAARSRRLGVLAAAVTAGLAVPGIASADVGDFGSPDPMSTGHLLEIFVGVPLVVFVVVALLVYFPRRGVTADHYRPGRPWRGTEPEWTTAQGDAPEPQFSESDPKMALPGAGGADGRF